MVAAARVDDRQQSEERAQTEQQKGVGEGRGVEGVEGVERIGTALAVGGKKGAKQRRSGAASEKEEHLVARKSRGLKAPALIHFFPVLSVA